jgi:hypothetical protein
MIPGLGTLGSSFSLLNPELTQGLQLIDLSFSLNRTTPDRLFKLPDNFLYTENRKCYLKPVTRVANNVKDF